MELWSPWQNLSRDMAPMTNANSALAVLFATILLANGFAASAQTCTHSVARQPSPQRLAAARTMHQACAADMAALCSAVPAGCGERQQCLMAHRAQLSSTCAGAIQTLHMTR
jgi:hypothetical protein